MSTKNERALAFFKIISEEEKTYTCKLCNEVKIGNKKSNLVQHLQLRHKDVYTEEVFQQIDPNSAKEMQLKLLQCMVEKVTINGRPIASLNDSGYLKSIDDKLRVLAKVGFGIHLRDKKYTQIKKYISDTTSKITERVKTEAAGKRISLMLDIATKNHKSILGINLRYIIDGSITERCIGMIPLEERHTSRNLAIEIKKCLDKFGITVQQIYSITTDNARNVVGVVDNLDEEILCAAEEEANPSSTDSVLESTAQVQSLPQSFGVEDDEIHAIYQQALEEDALQVYLNDNEEYADLLKRAIGDLAHHFNEYTISVRCGSHTVHLVVRAALKNSNIIELVAVCGKAAKLLRQEAYVREARKHDLHYIMPHLNVETRWDSDCLMVNI